jgi:hypothetical protein
MTQKQASVIAKRLTSVYDLEPQLGRDDVIASTQCVPGGQWHNTLARTYGDFKARRIIDYCQMWSPEREGNRAT